MKKFSLLENFEYTNDEIEDIFLSYIDDNKDSNIDIKDGFISSREMRFFVDVAKINKETKLCKRVELFIDNIADGVIDYTGNRSITSINKLSGILSEINSFYLRTKDKINFVIDPSYDAIKIVFFIIGPKVDNSYMNTKNEINDLLTELKIIIKNLGYKRVKYETNNWLEIRTKKSNSVFSPEYIITNILRRSVNGTLQNYNDDRFLPIINWANKINGKYDMSISGGTNQVVVSLKKL